MLSCLFFAPAWLCICPDRPGAPSALAPFPGTAGSRCIAALCSASPHRIGDEGCLANGIHPYALRPLHGDGRSSADCSSVNLRLISIPCIPESVLFMAFTDLATYALPPVLSFALPCGSLTVYFFLILVGIRRMVGAARRCSRPRHFVSLHNTLLQRITLYLAPYPLRTAGRLAMFRSANPLCEE